ncbi:hypothetical protein C2845_PM11G10230 [Panicum miliaceum]|uniref:F-box domain-containing protein n=1 Tax=Panicum miliaceum TaxID=4540 RepID=A0A3L6RVM6_PANMI|nr:hypothetical protein C2845_PM11G10230 [Panicum miliaceum]
MATPKLCNAGDLPLDAVYEILLRLPAKPLCRLRAACRLWRSLLSDPEFAAAHAAREPPLIIAGYNCYSSEISLVNIMDLSGDIVKQVRLDGHRVMSMPLHLACVRTTADGSCRLVDSAAATGSKSMQHCYSHVREGEHPIDCDGAKYLFGQVASTAEYKALRKVTPSHVGEYGFLYEVCTLSRGGRRPQWRAVQGPPNTFGWAEGTSVAIGGLVYFLMADVYLGVRRKTPVIQQAGYMHSTLRQKSGGPTSRDPKAFFPDNNNDNNNNIAAGDPNHRYREIQLSLASLNGSLVIVHGPSPNMDIWFLMDAEKGLWVKKYSILIERSCSYFWPLVVLDDGRIVIVLHGRREEIKQQSAMPPDPEVPAPAPPSPAHPRSALRRAAPRHGADTPGDDGSPHHTSATLLPRNPTPGRQPPPRPPARASNVTAVRRRLLPPPRHRVRRGRSRTPACGASSEHTDHATERHGGRPPAGELPSGNASARNGADRGRDASC